MCVIAVKPKGVSLPTEAALKSMWDTNSDGAGYMYNLNGRVHIKKGFMTFDAFKASVDETYNMLRNLAINAEDTAFVYHFRIATHGTVIPQNTHPFPVSDVVADLGTLEITTDLGMAHNGVISKIDTDKESNLTDTATFIKDVVAPFHKYSQTTFLGKPNIIKTFENVIGASKLSFLDGEGNITKVGYWQDGEDGLCYSNLNHNRPVYVTSSVYSQSTGYLYNKFIHELDLNKYSLEAKVFSGFNEMSKVNDNYLGTTFRWFVDEDGEILLRTAGKYDDKLYPSTLFNVYEEFKITEKATNKVITNFIDIGEFYNYPTLRYDMYLKKKVEVVTATPTPPTTKTGTLSKPLTLKNLKPIPIYTYYLVFWSGSPRAGKGTYDYLEVDERNKYYVSENNVLYERQAKDRFLYLGVVGKQMDIYISTSLAGKEYSYAYDSLVHVGDDGEVYPVKPVKDFKNVYIIL